MADKTKIEWTDATWNPITGCSIVSPGCTNCYAMRLAGTRLKHHSSRAGLTRDTKAGPVWTGEVRFNEAALDQPLRWRRPRMIFVCAHGDLFAENVSDEWIDRVFAVMALAPQHIFQVLTKRAERMRDYLSKPAVGLDWFNVVDNQFGETELWDHPGLARDLRVLPNVWLGVSAEDQRRADERVPILLSTPAAVRWVSAEPLLGPLDFRHVPIMNPGGMMEVDALSGIETIIISEPQPFRGSRLDWIVAGGESGIGARPMHPDWVRSIRDQCADANVPFLFKQWGAWSPVVAEADENGELEAVPALAGCSDPSVHQGHHECRFWQGDGMVHWPHLETLPAIGARLIGKKAAGRTLDGVTHDAFPIAEEVPFA